MARLILTGDVNLMNVTDPAVPFRRVAAEFRAADMVFSNLECCLYAPPKAHSFHNEGFYANPAIAAAALQAAAIGSVGIANNVNYGDAAILNSIAALDQAGIPHSGAGVDQAAARAPVIVERGGIRFGFLQRSSVYWPTNHAAGEHDPGIAVIRAHTAYQVPMHKTRPEIPPMNRPGIPPIVVTWPDQDSLRAFTDDITSLRSHADIVVASCHWGLGKDTLSYMRDIGRAAIDAGADIVIGHGPHYSLAVEVHRGKPIFYGLGSFSFHTGHGGRAHGNWVGMMVRADVTRDGISAARFQFVRHNAANETVLCALADEAAEFADIVKRSAEYGTRLEPAGNEVNVILGD
ncbi:MAG TPA: CapA family protein [Acetobacteraceae bacterium]|jgi:poly-gamma-glutamate synthesis protein (capsule biosynthesis protein)|nr:CapA family protein [Acetobacteraceae bacterium]